ncbi:MAG: hypothetical protein RDU24_05225 [Humidesulfovibrio sp.]|uniref:hypothetical protein n=1 Tax=Humidesulfovibrio sp. TaxID=2910988 RepID=UPI0027EBD9D5|nr:hypothetical protein [Humidesulfovibrio sp.]MDQ7834763.1 hypothetical protein [Humidesulfovibrio sp.]
MTKDSNFSVLFMRDGSDVKSFRVSPRRLKLLLWIAGILGLLVTIALAVGLRSFVGYRLLLNERRSLESSLAEAQVNLERLGNLDKIQKAQGKDSGKGQAAEKSSPASAQPASAQRAFAQVNTGAMTVENFRGQVGSQSVSVTFDLNNRASGALSGEIRLLLLRNDGSLTPLDVPAQDLTYQIQRFKRISTSAPVPEGLTRREALGLRIEIKTSEGELIFGETYALGN